MRIVNLGGRAQLQFDGGVRDIAQASGGRYGPSVHDVLDAWDAFHEWAAAAPTHVELRHAEPAEYGAAVPAPRQVFAVGLNYRLHADESGFALPTEPVIFTKFPSSVASPSGILELPTDSVDWEVELAVIIGATASRVNKAAAWDHVAGLTAAQDFSARDVQFAGGNASQFSLGKSFTGFLPLGPVIVTPDEFRDRNDLAIECLINGKTVQASTTANLIFDVATLVSYISHVVTLLPGDVILTGTPSGVALGMAQPRYLRAGDVVTTRIESIGELVQSCIDAAPRFVGADLVR